MQHKLRMSREAVLETAVEAVKRAKGYTSDVEFSAEDAFRSDVEFLCRVLAAVIAAGATTVNIPDTVGYAMPDEFGEFIRQVLEGTPGIEKAVVSVHCHNDLGLAVANSLAAVRNGARQVECTVNGIGERAGNAALEEVVMALYTRREKYGLTTGIRTEEIYRTSKLVSTLTGMPVQFNKAIVGKNAFLHESGIHQDGVLKERTTYEIINPSLVGINPSNLVLGKHSGRHAFRERLRELGFELRGDELNQAFVRFKELADTKKHITDEDLEAILDETIRQVPSTFELEYLHIFTGTTVKPTAVIGLLIEGEFVQDVSCGNGPVDAAYKAIEKATGRKYALVSYVIDAVTGGTDALASVTVKVRDEDRVYTGRGVSADVLEASARAYVNVLNKIVYDEKTRKQHN
jgi:2-isopropylmalate synthase